MLTEKEKIKDFITRISNPNNDILNPNNDILIGNLIFHNYIPMDIENNSFRLE